MLIIDTPLLGSLGALRWTGMDPRRHCRPWLHLAVPTFTFIYWNIHCHFVSSEPSTCVLASHFITFRNSKLISKGTLKIMKGSSRKVPGMPLINGRKDRDEDLLLFKELHKHEKDRHASLLQPVSDEFEPSFGGSHALYRIASGRKGSGYEVFGEKDKNDYDWLKTPPATPLFPSLEMEANAPEHVVQREIPIIQPLSRFSDNSEALKRSTVKLKNPNSKPNKIPQRSVTPSQKQRISSSTENKNSKAVAQILNQKMAQFTTDSNKQTNVITNPAKPTTDQKASQTNFLSSNLSKDIKTKPINRGVAASDRSTIPAQILGFSNDTPPNLRTDRATSATRGRPAAANPTASVHKKQDSTPRPRRQSCSPSVTRGRKEIIEGNLTTPKGKTLTGSNGAQIFGSRMVDKVMNARKLGTEEREGKPKQQGATKSANSSANASPSHGFGRMMMMTKSQMDTAFKHMEITRDRITSRHLGIPSGRSSGQN